MFISVLICTRNRAASLEITLRRFFEQRFSGGYDHELIIVDNASTDATRGVTEACAARHPSVRYLLEPRLGLSHARNAALMAARGDIIVFTDDDVRPNADWLDEIHGEFARDSRRGLLGGRVLLAHDGLQAVSYQPSTERQEFTFPASGSFVIGANMAFRREVFERVGGFDTRLGAGRYFAGAEEVDLFYRALKAGYRQLYAPNVLVYHDHDRTQLDQVCHMEFSYGKGLSAHLVKHALGGDIVALTRLVRLLASQPGRWRRRAGEPREAPLRRRAQSRGVLLGLATAPVAMWPRPEARAFTPAREAQAMARQTVTIITEAAAFGGSVVHTFGLIEALVRRGAAVEVVANRFDPYTDWVAARSLIEHVRVIPAALAGITPQHPADMRRWKDLLGELKGDLLIFPKGHYYHGRLEFLRACRRRFRTVAFIEHLEAPPKPAPRARPLLGFLPSPGFAWRRRKQRQREAARCADLIVAVSSKVRDRLVQDWGAPADEIVVVRNGVRWQDFQRDVTAGLRFREAHGVAPNDFVFGMMTRLTQVKGIDLALAAASRLGDAEPSRAFRLVIAGEGPDHDALVARADELKLGLLARFVGRVARPLEALSAFDVILFSSRFEGLPLALLEGMAAGCVPIVTHVGGMGEAVDSREVGWLVGPEDPAALATAMGECLRLDATALDAMRHNAIARVRAEFDGESCYERILDLCGVPATGRASSR